MLSDNEERDAERFLDDLDARLAAAGEPGSSPWRAARDAQAAWLHDQQLWEPDEIGHHLGLSARAVRVAIDRHHTREAAAEALPAFADGPTTGPPSAGPARWSVRIPDYSLDLTVDHETASRLHALAGDHGITVYVTRVDEPRSRTPALRSPQTR